MTKVELVNSRSELRPEGNDERQVRVARERELLAQARADMDAGLGTDWNDVEAWLHRLDHDENALAPEAAGQPIRR